MQDLERRAIREARRGGEYAVTFDHARDLVMPLRLPFALEVTLEMAGRDDLLYDAMAVQLVERAISERRLDLHSAL